MKKLDITKYKNIVVLTGAGISVASGLRTYRGPNGLWEEGDTARVSQLSILDEEPQLVWKFFGPLKEKLLSAQPNEAHYALARLEAQLTHEQSMLIVTQNIDELHQRAGSKNVVEIHGSVMTTRCSNRGCALEPFPDVTPHDGEPPCEKCGQMLRPDIVFFGEELPLNATWATKKALRDVDLFLAIGTSGTVSPASGFVSSAKYAGARTILINLQKMEVANPHFDEEILGKAEEVLPKLLNV